MQASSSSSSYSYDVILTKHDPATGVKI